MRKSTTVARPAEVLGRKPFIYLDNASTTFPKPECVYKFMNSFYRQYGVNPGRAKGYPYQQAETILVGTRARLTEFFHAQNPERLIFTYNATDALNMVIGGILKHGDHVITTMLEHNAVIRPLNHIALKTKISVDWVRFDRHGYIAPEDIKKKIRKNTRLVIVTHASNVLGTIQPVAEIGRICRAAGVIFAIDAAQTAGIVPINIQKSGIDIIAFTGHKSLLGPMGIGGMHIRAGINIDPIRYGGTGILSQEKYQPELFPYYLECGTLNMVGVAGLFAAQNYLQEVGIRSIYEHEIELSRRLCRGLAKIDNLTLYSRPKSGTHVGIISCRVNGCRSDRVGNILEKRYGIYTRTGLHCAPLVHENIGTAPDGTIRLSVGPFNTTAEIDQTVSALREIAGQCRRKGV